MRGDTVDSASDGLVEEVVEEVSELRGRAARK
jgi:hypothetical protein